MFLGVSSYTYGWSVGIPGYSPSKKLSPEGLIEKAKALGVEVLQIADNCPLHTLGEDDLINIQKKAEENNIKLELGTRGIEPDFLKKYLQIAKLLRANLLRVLLDSPLSSPNTYQVITWIQEILPECREKEVYIAIENHDQRTTKELKEIVETIDDPMVGICLDTVNSLGALECPHEVVENLAPYVLNIHLKDFEIMRLPHQQGFIVEGRPLGRGKLDAGWVIETVKNFGKDPNLILELWVPLCETIDKTIEKEEEWAYASVEYARSLLSFVDGRRTSLP